MRHIRIRRDERKLQGFKACAVAALKKILVVRSIDILEIKVRWLSLNYNNRFNATLEYKGMLFDFFEGELCYEMMDVSSRN